MTHFFLSARKFIKIAEMKKKKKRKKPNKVPKSAEKCEKAGFHGIGATVRTRRESRCLPYAGLF